MELAIHTSVTLKKRACQIARGKDQQEACALVLALAVSRVSKIRTQQQVKLALSRVTIFHFDHLAIYKFWILTI